MRRDHPGRRHEQRRDQGHAGTQQIGQGPFGADQGENHRSEGKADRHGGGVGRHGAGAGVLGRERVDPGLGGDEQRFRRHAEEQAEHEPEPDGRHDREGGERQRRDSDGEENQPAGAEQGHHPWQDDRRRQHPDGVHGGIGTDHGFTEAAGGQIERDERGGQGIGEAEDHGRRDHRTTREHGGRFGKGWGDRLAAFVGHGWAGPAASARWRTGGVAPARPAAKRRRKSLSRSAKGGGAGSTIRFIVRA